MKSSGSKGASKSFSKGSSRSGGGSGRSLLSSSRPRSSGGWNSRPSGGWSGGSSGGGSGGWFWGGGDSREPDVDQGLEDFARREGLWSDGRIQWPEDDAGRRGEGGLGQALGEGLAHGIGDGLGRYATEGAGGASGFWRGVAVCALFVVAILLVLQVLG